MSDDNCSMTRQDRLALAGIIILIILVDVVAALVGVYISNVFGGLS